MNRYTYYNYPFLNPKYIETFLVDKMISLRVQYAMNASDEVQSNDKICNRIQTVVINGSKDGATPVENVDAYLKNKNCASYQENYALIVTGGGHSNLIENLCVQDFILEIISGQKQPVLKSCDAEIIFKKY